MSKRTTKPLLLHTRPISPQAQEFTQEIEAAGAQVLHVPLSTVEPAEEDQIRSASNTYNGIVISSANALRFYAPAEEDLQKPVYVVGPQTGNAAQMSGFTDIRLQAPDMDALIRALHEGPVQGVTSLLYLRGRVVSVDLKEALAGAFDVTERVTYRVDMHQNLPPSLQEALDHGHVAGVALFSRQTARHFIELCRAAGILEKLASINPLSISNSVLECVRPYCDAHAYIAQTPDQAGLIAAARQWLADVQAQKR